MWLLQIFKQKLKLYSLKRQTTYEFINLLSFFVGNFAAWWTRENKRRPRSESPAKTGPLRPRPPQSAPKTAELWPPHSAAPKKRLRRRTRRGRTPSAPTTTRAGPGGLRPLGERGRKRLSENIRHKTLLKAKDLRLFRKFGRWLFYVYCLSFRGRIFEWAAILRARKMIIILEVTVKYTTKRIFWHLSFMWSIQRLPLDN